MDRQSATGMTPTLHFELKNYEQAPQVLSEDLPPKPPTTPGEYYCFLMPSLSSKYGPPILEMPYTDVNGDGRTTAIELNDLWYAGLLGGDKRLGHDLIFYVPEGVFYFFDSRFGYYCPTTEPKLKNLLSWYMVKCAEVMPRSVDVGNLFNHLRSESVLKKVIEKAKSLLAADESFFVGSIGRKRKINEQVVDPTLEPPYKLFVKEGVELKPGAIVFINELYDAFVQYCQEKNLPPIQRRQFSGLVRSAIQEEYGVGQRKDLKNGSGKYAVGWKNLTFKPDRFQLPTVVAEGGTTRSA